MGKTKKEFYIGKRDGPGQKSLVLTVEGCIRAMYGLTNRCN